MITLMPRLRPRGTIRLSTVVTLVLAGATGCGCPEPETVVTEHEGILDIVLELERIRYHNETPQDRCEAACLYLDDDDEPFGEITDCMVEVADATTATEDPWDESVTAIDIRCTTTTTTGGFCTGRRPQGHHEVALAGASSGAWLAAQACLERASITAFEELAQWLADRGAPVRLVARCRAAAADELRHAERMTALARREGVEPPVAPADAPADDRLAVALHNAVEGCVNEAFAAVVAAHQAQVVHDPQLRETFETIARDELRHGQLAWDLHAWLMDGLDEDERETVDRAWQRALAELPHRAEQGARATPLGMGWPTPRVAVQMARRFATLADDALRAA